MNRMPWDKLNIFRLCLYVSLPVLATMTYSDPVVMHKIVTTLNYIIYPAEAPRPPIGDEIQKYREAPRPPIVDQIQNSRKAGEEQ